MDSGQRAEKTKDKEMRSFDYGLRPPLRMTKIKKAKDDKNKKGNKTRVNRC